MPNWCAGTLRVRGTKENLTKFVLEGLQPVDYIGEDLEALKMMKRSFLANLLLLGHHSKELMRNTKKKTAEQMFKDLDYKKRIEDGCIKFERHTENVDEALIEFDLDTKTVCASWFMEQKEITIAELRAINKQCEELNWL